jgi:hypothetical protein
MLEATGRISMKSRAVGGYLMSAVALMALAAPVAHQSPAPDDALLKKARAIHEDCVAFFGARALQPQP